VGQEQLKKREAREQTISEGNWVWESGCLLGQKKKVRRDSLGSRLGEGGGGGLKRKKQKRRVELQFQGEDAIMWRGGHFFRGRSLNLLFRTEEIGEKRWGGCREKEGTGHPDRGSVHGKRNRYPISSIARQARKVWGTGNTWLGRQTVLESTYHRGKETKR